MSWTYEQKTGILRRPDGVQIAKGYAGGNAGKNKEGVNNPDMQNVHDIGPLPQGKYTFGQVVEGTHLGPFAITLIPDVSNTMFGRGGFFMHGDHIGAPGTASDGCIVMPLVVREAAKKDSDQSLVVVHG